MSADWIAAISSFATFVVISATAVTAVIQLRHVRNSNQLAILTEYRHQMESEPLRAAYSFAVNEAPKHWADEAFRREMLSDDSPRWHKLRDLGNFLDGMGTLVRNGMIDRDLACDVFYGHATRTWAALAPLIASQREMSGYKVWEDFEYLMLLCERFRKRYPDGTYPKNEPRVPLPEPWPEAAAR